MKEFFSDLLQNTLWLEKEVDKTRLQKKTKKQDGILVDKC
jgi:hypothetical protein